MDIDHARRFEALMALYFSHQAWKVTNLSEAVDAGFDFLVERADGLRGAVEVKYYRGEHVSIGVLRRAMSSLVVAGRRFEESSEKRVLPLLIVSALVSRSDREVLQKEFSVGLVDRGGVLKSCEAYPTLYAEMRQLFSLDDEEQVTGDAEPPQVEFLEGWRQRAYPLFNEGAKLCKRLRSIPRGKKGWRLFERVGEDALKLLFGSALTAWEAQKRTDDGMLRYDLVCRIRSESGVWQFIGHQLNSRYMVCEFKNYSKPIGQNQLYISEKYLFPRALRTFALLLTREGLDKGGRQAVESLMREQGKLFLALTEDEICEMLHAFDRGEDPSDLLFLKIDKFLLGLRP